MPRGLEHLRDQVSAGVVVGRAGIAAGEHSHFEVSPRVALMFLYTQPAKLYITGTFRKA
jgi:murein DD-endopeptidase MepM/ murein hydrolase activator NlpD